MQHHPNDDPALLVTEIVELPNLIRTGRYDVQRRRDPNGRVFVSNANTAFIWLVFKSALEGGQSGSMSIRNAPGTFLVGTTFTEWDVTNSKPEITDAFLTLKSVERGEGLIRVVGRNVSGKTVHAAVGIIIGDDAPYPVAPGS